MWIWRYVAQMVLLPSMASTTITTVSGMLLGSPRGPLAVRVSGGRRQSQVVSLRSSKITVGSSPVCTFRLRGAGIKPLHCVILRGASRTVVRRFDADTLLNETAFDEAPLSAGDSLAVGPVKLEIIQGAGPDPRTTSARRQMRHRARRVIGELRGERTRADGLEQAIASQGQQLAASSRRIRDLEDTAKSLGKQLRQHEIERADERRQMAERTAQLDEQSRQNVAERERLAAREQELEQEQLTLAERLTDCQNRQAALADEQRRWREFHDRQIAADHAREARLEELETHLVQQQASIRRHETELAQIESELSERQISLAPQLAELAARETALTEQASKLESQSQTLVQQEQLLAEREQHVERVLTERRAAEVLLKQKQAEVEHDKSLLEQSQSALTAQQAALGVQRQRLDALQL